MSKHTPRDWDASASSLVSAAQKERSQAESVRKEALAVAQETSELLQLTQRAVENQFSLRLDEVNTHRLYIQRTIENVQSEISSAQVCVSVLPTPLSPHAPQAAKDTVDGEIAAKKIPLDITQACLAQREGRQGIDKVRDNVEIELEKVGPCGDHARLMCVKEVALLEQIKKQLADKSVELNEDMRFASCFEYISDIETLVACCAQLTTR
jgi:hypothetical protein